MRILAAVLIAMLLVLQHRLWVGEGGLAEVWRLKQAISAQSQENATLHERNRALEAEVDDLKGGLEAIEERARSELGMIRDAEVFMQIVDEDR